ncbi:CPBP family intramembrane glutamic endopeptidase [uncultured Draconibacterium sp.]|uniref:CPBP family intramembrane glutamic endopeptidase n=1 Tax=uncultured Draconibacterium sp. TaxID=1573823 RepID=UPI0025CF115D|nr:CPBP family intramembrane glutamic endopeptidase [uncultured Draconibacterium sp.]
MIPIIPKDIKFGLFLLGGCGPLVAGYLMQIINSNAKLNIGLNRIFLIVATVSTIVIIFRLYLIKFGMPDTGGFFPTLNEISAVGYFIIILSVLILSINAGNAVNQNIKENYIQSFLFNRRLLNWYLIAFFVFPIIFIISYFIGKLINAPTTDYIIKSPPSHMLIGVLAVFYFFGGNEEFGFRGYLQKELQKKISPLVTALIISILWTFWHLPLYYNGIYSTNGISLILPRLIFTLPMSVIFVWFYNKSSYSILTVMILHAMINSSSGIIGNSELIAIILYSILSVVLIIESKMWKRKSFDFVYNVN